MHHMHMVATNVQVRLKHQNSNNSTLIRIAEFPGYSSYY